MARGDPTTGQSLGILTPTPGRQLRFVGGALSLIPIGALVSRPKTAYNLYTYVSPVVASYYKLKSLWPALGSEQKVGIRIGTEPSTRTLGSMGPIIRGQYGPDYMDRVPFPYPDIGIMAVPNSSSRMIWESKKQSKGGQDTSRTRSPITRKSIRGPSALDPLDKKAFASRSRKSKTGPSSKRRPVGAPSKQGKATKKRTRGRFSRRGRPTPWCWRHRKSHWCEYTR